MATATAHAHAATTTCKQQPPLGGVAGAIQPQHSSNSSSNSNNSSNAQEIPNIVTEWLSFLQVLALQ
jgi:hypothetical protein